MQSQTYAPYRNGLLSRGELRRLYLLNPKKVVIDTFINWLVIVLCWLTVAAFPLLWVQLTAIFIIGTQVYALIIIAHDGLHRRLFNTIKNNDLWNDVFILGAIGAITRLNRINHMRHHNELALTTDPDRFKYTLHGRESKLQLMLSLTCVSILLKAIRNVFIPKHKMKLVGFEHEGEVISHKESGRYNMRDILIIFFWQTLLIWSLTYVIGWWAYLILWVLPVIFALCCDILRVFCEHSSLANDLDADLSIRLVSFEPNAMERLLFSPHNMNNHIAHHLWPAIPYYNLPSAEFLIKSKLTGNENLTWRHSYLKHILNYWKWVGKVGFK